MTQGKDALQVKIEELEIKLERVRWGYNLLEQHYKRVVREKNKLQERLDATQLDSNTGDSESTCE